MEHEELSPQFFLGIELTEHLLASLDPRLLKIFGSYLDRIEYEHSYFLGKISSKPLNYEQLEQLEAHVLSVFQRLGSKKLPSSCILLPLSPQTVSKS
ncbi:MAG: hypothetical protein JSR97_09675 [Verrucomicrobia bacterium]|nr:hypothetical protein [Verrucomicrobiota bacterium]